MIPATQAHAPAAERPRSPVIHRDGTVEFRFAGPGQSVELVGDMNDWLGGTFLQRGGEDEWFSHRARFPLDARLEYVYRIDGRPDFVADPLNPFRIPNGWGMISELVMPEFAYRPEFDLVRKGAVGGYDRVEAHALPKGRLPYGHEVFVFVPERWEKGDDGLPVLYLQDGRDYIEYGHTPQALDQLINQNRIEPVIAVFIDPPNRHQPGPPNRMTEYGMNDDYVAFVAEEVVPFIDNRYPTRVGRAARMIAGASYGGLISTWIAIRRPDVFGAAYSQSGYFSFDDDRLIRHFRDATGIDFAFYFDVGTYEEVVGSDFLPAAERDFLAANRKLAETLRDRRLPFRYREYPEGHTWGNWRAHLLDVLERHFNRDEER